MCTEATGCSNGRMCEEGGRGLSRVREVMNYQGWVRVPVIRPSVSASWQAWSSDSVFPQRLGNRQGPYLFYGDISKAWLPSF